MKRYRLKSSKPYKIIKCKRGKNLTKINISSERRNSKSITNLAGRSSQCSAFTRSLVLYMQPSLPSPVKQSHLVPLPRVKEAPRSLKRGCP